MLKLIQLTQSAYSIDEICKDWFFLIDTNDKTYSPLGMHPINSEFVKKLVFALNERIGFKHEKVEIQEAQFYKLLSELEYKNP